MKKFEYYEEKAKKELLEALEAGSVAGIKGLDGKSIKELNKTTQWHVKRKMWREMARSLMKKDRIAAIRMITPASGSKMNGITLDKGIVLPVFAPMILDTAEITENQMILGLFIMLQKVYDEYYLNLLKSFTIDRKVMTPEFLEMINSDKKQYWKKRKISTKVKK